jgi:3,5-epimerase/4-reductase
MLWLLYGSRGWIGTQILKLLVDSNETVIEATSRADNYQATMDEIKSVMPDRVICTIGRTSGAGCSNIDYLEQPGKLVENLRDNLHGPLNLASICQQLGIHLTYLGTGCIYEYTKTHPMDPYENNGFTEDDLPNFTGSQYSAVKGVTDQLIRQFKTTLNARIRMPISAEKNPRNFVTKITQYKKVISIPNSMTVLPELLPIMIDLAKNKVTGTVNLVNPGCITHGEILDLYKQYVDPNFTYEIMDLSDLPNYTVGRRSNNYLETTKLQSMYPNVLPIKESIRQLFQSSPM